MNATLRSAYEVELRAAETATATAEGDVKGAFHHLERAHILSQRHTSEHVHVHWLMLRLAASTGAWREVFGQSTRIAAAAVFSRLWVPMGNTGRSNVSAVKPMPIPPDLLSVLERDGG